MPLMKQLPDSRRRASARARVRSRVQRLLPSPKSVSLASAIACSMSRARMTGATGPNVSSRKTGLEGIGDGLHHDKALGRDAALAGILEARAHRHGGGGVEVGVVEHDEVVRP